VASILAVGGLVAYKLATAPVAGMETAPISAGTVAGLPGISGQQAIPVSAEARDAMMLEKAFTPQATALLGVRVLDLTGRDDESTINVRLSAEAVDFTVLHRNETFSFNKIVGIRTTERGYQSGLMYSNGQVVSGVGGGICITASVIYNVALETGMKIIERHPHSGPVAYADPGRDSAVAYGALDLQFKNKTGGVVLIRSIVSDGKLVVAFYGRKQPGREIEIASEGFEPIAYEVTQKEDATVPEGETVIEQNGKPGYSVTTVRITRQDGKVGARELISRDVMRPRNEVVLVHAPSGAPMGNPLELAIPTYEPTPTLTDMPLALPEPPQSRGDALHVPEPAISE
jgi:hypothetical protein